MIFLDSNIVIYLIESNLYPKLYDQLSGEEIAISSIVRLEVLSAARLSDDNISKFTKLLDSFTSAPLDDRIAEIAAKIRRQTRIKTPDAVIAATALNQAATLWTHNIEDFEKIEGLSVFDPIAS